MSYETNTNEAHAVLSYDAIGKRLNSLSACDAKTLREVAGAFGVLATGSKATVIGSIRTKIERRKSTMVRCAF
jgi:hypothetical protein